MKQHLVETAKNILIVLLICSLLLLAASALPAQSVRSVPWLSRLLQPVAPLLGLPEADLTYVAQATQIPGAAQPIAISVKNDAGRYTAMWDFTELDRTFEIFSPLLGQALDQAEHFTLVSESQILQALKNPGVYFRYSHALPAALPASWLGSSLEAAVGEIGCYILSEENGTVVVYLLGKESYTASTDLAAEELSSLLQTCRPDGSQFAFETELALSPLSLIPGDAPAVPAFTLSNPCDSRYIDTLATELGFNPYAESRYTDDLGTVRFSETNAALEITASGHVTLRAEAERFAALSVQPKDLADTARQLVGRITANTPGDGRLYLSDLTVSGTTAVCTFDYFISGLPVAMAGEAARVTFEGSSVTEASVQVLAFTGTGKTIRPLPVTQAAAVLGEGSTLELSYCVNADNTVSAGWQQ